MHKIYESPDGGKTVYQRESGSTERELIRDPDIPDGSSLYEYLMEETLWSRIRHAAKTNPALHSAMDRVKVLYYLNMKNGNNI